jgi:hypothetical protein
LGRTHADMDQALQAVQSYQDAIEAADTTSADCDYNQMGIIYTQMSNVFYYNCLYREQLDCLDKAIYYGSLAKDTLGVLLAYTQKIGGYTLLQNPDSMQYVCNEVSRLFLQAGYPQLSAAVQANPVSYLIETGQIEQAHQHLMAYEHGSGFFDKDNNIQPGREIYYYHKGIYCLATCQYDSAEYYFRKELRLGKDFNNQNSASRGLSLLFQKTHRPDSAAKYALYSYEMNDSMHFHKYAHEISRMRTLYDYSRFQHQAMQEKEKAERSRNYFLTVLAIAGVFLLVIVIVSLRYRSIQIRRKQEIRKYYELIAAHDKTRKELSILLEHQAQFQLSQNEKALNSLVKQKEEELSCQEKELSHYKGQIEMMKAAEKAELGQLYKTGFYSNFVDLTDKGKAFTEDDWNKVEKYLKKHLPEFFDFLMVRRGSLTNYEYHVAMLVRLHVNPKSISNVTELDGSYVDRVRRSLLKKMFNTEGKAKVADILIRQIGQFVE